jgi:hypothetical protein
VLLPFNLEVRDDGSTISFLETVEWVWRQSVSFPSFASLSSTQSSAQQVHQDLDRGWERALPSPALDAAGLGSFLYHLRHIC